MNGWDYVFPQDEESGCDDAAGNPVLRREGGLRVRDYFAAQMMPAFVDLVGRRWRHIDGSVNVVDMLDEVAPMAYWAADALLKARERTAATNGTK